jgi:hypothetical protein
VGVVLGKGGGALKKMVPIFKLGGGGPVGSGQQYMSWIHVEDLADILCNAIDNKNIINKVYIAETESMSI